MNDWDDMDEEVKEAQRLDETRILDASNVHAGLIQQRNTNNLLSAVARGGFHEINAPSDVLPG